MLAFLFVVVLAMECEARPNHGKEDPFFSRSLNSYVENLRNKIARKLGWNPGRFYFPGTKWCGVGNKAAHYHDLGKLRDIDICCRQHDKCGQGIIRAGQTKYGIRNTLFYPLLPCHCDVQLAHCLKTGNSLKKHLLGYMVFVVGKIKCFTLHRSLYGRPIARIHTTSFNVSNKKWLSLLVSG